MCAGQSEAVENLGAKIGTFGRIDYLCYEIAIL